MGIFKTLKEKLFGKPEPIFKAFRSREDADIAAGGQANRRRRLLERRVENRKNREQGKRPASHEGEGEEVYPNRKKVHSEASLAGGVGSSPYIEAFYLGYPLSQFASSNVWALQYDKKTKILYMQFMAGSGKKKSGPGKWYAYSQVSMIEARVAFNMASKGIFNWQYLRRGKKPFVKGVSPPGHLPYRRDKKPRAFVD